LATKNILITAGPTWVEIDSVRVISNKASAETGILLAEIFAKRKDRVTLLLGPSRACCLNEKIKVIPFRFFDELKKNLFRQLYSKKYDIVIHSAAVSDYKPDRASGYKISSGIKKWRLTLVPTPKLIDRIKKIDRALFLVGFKFQPRVKKIKLLEESKDLLRRSNADLVVGNTIDKNRYKAFIVAPQGTVAEALNKEDLADKLVKLIMERI